MKGALTHTLRVFRASCGAKKQRKNITYIKLERSQQQNEHISFIGTNNR